METGPNLEVTPTVSASPGVSPDPCLTPFRVVKSPRVLACILCQQRKVKCDRKFPCANCIKSRIQCVPATPNRRQPRRSEQELSDRLRKYEELLHQNNIPFERLSGELAHDDFPFDAGSGNSVHEEHSQTTNRTWVTMTASDENTSHDAAESVWHSMIQGQSRDTDDKTISSDDAACETAAKRALNESSSDNVDDLFFGSIRPMIEIATLHPTPAQVFKLWQIYLENVDPLLKITHTPTLQRRLVDAASNLASIPDPNLEALMFGIYCISVLSLAPGDCRDAFGSQKEVLSMRFQRGCQQALSKCRFIRTTNRDCLCALFLYLLSITPQTVPQSLSIILAIAIRIAQNMGMHSEVALAKHTPFEAELRRRLWWSLVLFDIRMCELANSKIRTLDPTWDCKIPLNVNDSDLRVDMRMPPVVQAQCTDALFIVVRCESRDFARYTPFHINYINPALRFLARDSPKSPGSAAVELVHLEQTIEDRYFRHCDEDNPVHFVTIWATRAYLAKLRLLEHQSRYAGLQQTNLQCDAATSYAIRMLDSDTRIMTSHLTKGFLWLNHHYFPFLGYMQISHHLRMRPLCGQRQQAWEVMSDNYEAWSSDLIDNKAFFKAFAKIIMLTWELYEAALQTTTETVQVPNIIRRIKQTLEEIAQQPSNANVGNSFMGPYMRSEEIPASVPVDMDKMTLEMLCDIPGPLLGSPEMQQLHWDIFSWPP